jgi:predicted AlkP superfamily pyrophosphatase or phosphodiesterase
MPKTLFLLLDAFRGDYINPVDTPFLHAKSKEGIFASKLRSVAGFTQRTAIYSGSKGDKSGMFTMFTFDEEGSPFGFLRDDPRFARFANDSHWWDKLPKLPGFGRLKYHLRKKFRDVDRWDFIRSVDAEVKRRGAHAPLLNIPLFMLPEIGVSEDNRPIHLPGALSTETIFDVFVEERIPYDYAMFPVVVCEDDAVQQRVISQASGEAQVILGQLADSDACVHICGPSSYERRKVMGEIDRKLREIAVVYPPDTTWIVIGDHGMTDVVEEVDVSALARRHATEVGAVEGRDYLVFLDSTMARFLWKTETGRKMEGRLRDDGQRQVHRQGACAGTRDSGW